MLYQYNKLLYQENELNTRRVLQYWTAAHSTTQAKGLTDLAWHQPGKGKNQD